MKNKKLLDAFSLVDETYVEEADPDNKKPALVWKKLAYIAVAACLMLVIVLPIAFMGGDGGSVPVITSTFAGQTTQDAPTDPGDFPPDETQTPSTKRKSDLRPYENSPYYPLIEKLDAYYQQKALQDEYFGNYGGLPSETLGGAVTPDSPTVDKSQTVLPDFTDNQVEGVIEGDIVKRTETHIFAIQNDYLNVYDINGFNSRMVGSYEIIDGESGKLYPKELYLLDGGQTVLLVSRVSGESATKLVLLDVRSPADMQKITEIKLDGDVTSRVSEDSILLFARYQTPYAEPNYGDPCEFVPCITDESGTKPISFDDIILSDAVSGTYSVIYSLDSETLEVEGAKAFLGGMSAVYVSQNNIFVASSQYETSAQDGLTTFKKTLIRCFPYGNGSLEEKGCVTLDGYVKNQYSMDEKDGILRVVTTVEYGSYSQYDGYDWFVSAYTGASLYCVSLENFETVASVEKFAPEGEQVRSVRFDGNYAYVCTSLSFIDPVFFFDLSDLSNITYTDTGVIEGYSSSLVDFGNGNLLGIGYGSVQAQLKIEIYREEGNGVVSVAQYREYASFAANYKCYYIDRENQLIGLCVNRRWDDGDGCHYILLHFDGEKLVKVADHQTGGDLYSFRSVYIDERLYILGASDKNNSITFKVLRVIID